MPIFRSGKCNAPAWCELESFDLIDLARDARREVSRQGRKEELIVCRGRVRVQWGTVSADLGEGGVLDFKGASPRTFTIAAVSEALVFRAMGRWKFVNSSGIFSPPAAPPPAFDTPYTYRKTTGFDNHYHDCDEYWILFQGKARVASEGKLYDVGPGDCVATGMGWHHDVLSVKGDGPMRAVWFEGTLEGRKRIGHLWEPRHGKAAPRPKRV